MSGAGGEYTTWFFILKRYKKMSNYFKKSELKPWELALVEKYPLVFLEEDEHIKEFVKDADVNLRDGFEHAEGWAKLVDQLASTANALVTHLRANGHPEANIHGFICKEKFGTLAWQGNYDLPEPFNELWRAYTCYIENQSSCTCELTGKFGRTCSKKDGGWIRTLCEEEAKKNGYVWPTDW